MRFCLPCNRFELVMPITRSYNQSDFTPWASPLFRWAGSKRKLIPHLFPLIPTNFNRYIEPFAGSACLFFAIRPSHAVLGDINAELLKTYSTICRHPRVVARTIHSYPKTKRQYYALRRLAPDSLPCIERAARFTYLNRYSFNGVYRVNRAGQFNVPRGVNTGKLPSEQDFYRCSVAMRSTLFRTGDFMHCIEDVSRNDFVYLDPPYTITTRKTYGEYAYGSFTFHDEARLLKALRQIDNAGARFLLSYTPTPFLSRLPKRWTVKQLRVRRHIAGFAKARNTVDEVIVAN